MSFLSHVAFFLMISLIVALVTSLIRLRKPAQIISETTHFFVTISVGIGLCCVVVYVLEWIFVRRLV